MVEWVAATKVFGFGSNACGQLGIGHQTDASSPETCLFHTEDVHDLAEDDSIVKVAAGGSHTLLLFRSGACFAAGSNRHGQCGIPPEGTSPALRQTVVFRRVRLRVGDQLEGEQRAVERFVDVAATWEASFFLEADERSIHVRGLGRTGELGLGPDIEQTDTAESQTSIILLPTDSKIVRLAGGMRHVVVCTADGEVFGWGSSSKGQLGSEVKSVRSVWTPRRVEMSFTPDSVVTGRDFTFARADGGLFSLLGDTKRFLDLGSVRATAPFDNISAGWSSIYVISNGRISGIGRSDRGQLPSSQIPDLASMAAGSEHVLGLTLQGNVIAWGWGEHGNCGGPTDSSGCVRGRWNDIKVQLNDGEAVIGVGAGCATSFILVRKKGTAE